MRPCCKKHQVPYDSVREDAEVWRCEDCGLVHFKFKVDPIRMEVRANQRTPKKSGLVFGCGTLQADAAGIVSTVGPNARKMFGRQNIELDQGSR